ncbi:hypothetical protein BJ165DRAFT_1528764 [Panaeolus papilionaceus]|nr:hypothetical protein BJ165DRAFT_1528764 [Panaeolus papilionaceus]
MTAVPKHHKRHRTPSVAIQQEDEAFDAVVITSFFHEPFCCHHDLLLMDHNELKNVAIMFNSRLPRSTSIQLNDSDFQIRRSIELLSGIVPSIGGDRAARRPLTMVDEGGKIHPGASSSHKQRKARLAVIRRNLLDLRRLSSSTIIRCVPC